MIDRRTFLAGSGALMAVAALPAAAAAPRLRTRRIRAQDSTELHVKDWGGKGRPVILTHAWPLSADIWDEPATALTEAGYRVLAPDRRGFGRSGKPAAGYDFDTFADDLAAVVRELKVQDVKPLV